MIDEYLDKNDLDINDPATIARFDGMYVDFYLEDDMFEIEGKFFTIDNQLYIEVHDAVMHILEMAGKELRLAQVGQVFTATRPDNKRFYMAINRVYYIMENPGPEDFKKMLKEEEIETFFLKLTDVMVKFLPDKNKWQITKNKINMYYVGDIIEYDTIEELCEDNKDIMEGLWQAVVYEAYEEESDYMTTFLPGKDY
ncbi:MAG: hypothetical protein ACI4VM_04685 [Anaerovoracaceae bacterium]